MIPDARVLTQARKFSGDMASRWRSLKGDINTYVVDEDRLNLKEPQPGDVMTDGAGFDFGASDGRKQARFEQWFAAEMRSGVLEPVGEKQLRQGGHFSAKYVRSTSDSGIRDAGTRMRKEGIEPAYGRENLDQVFNAPVRVSQLETLYRRDFTALKGITDAVSKTVSDELATALSQGENPRKVASRINDRVDKVGLTRSRTLARTETVRSYSHGSLLRYERNNIDKVDVMNTEPCSVCASIIADNPHPVKEAYGIIPAHPNCMCAHAPRVPGAN